MGKIISRFLDTVGDGNGTKNFNLDYSVTPAKALFIPEKDKAYAIYYLSGFIQAPLMRFDRYGNLPALSNGITVHFKRFVGSQEEEVFWDVTNQVPITIMAQYASIAQFQNGFFGIGGGDDSFFYRGDLIVPFRVDDFDKWQIHVNLNDNFEGITQHLFRLGIFEL